MGESSVWHLEATRTTPLRRTCWIFSARGDKKRFAMKIFKDHTPKPRIKKEVYDWIDRLSIFSCTRIEWWFRDWASWTFRYFWTCHLSERYVKCMHTSCIQHSLIQPCMDACTQVHVIQSLANIFLVSSSQNATWNNKDQFRAHLAVILDAFSWGATCWLWHFFEPWVCSKT